MMGYTTAQAGEEASGWHFGLDVKQVYDPATTALAAVNPDFENIEDEVESIVFTYGEKWVPDRRPFFTDGAWYGPPEYVFYSRRVPKFDVGAKTFGEVRGLTFSALNALNFGDRNDSALAADYRLDEYQRAGFYFTGADWEGLRNRVLAGSYSHERPLSQGDLGFSANVGRSATSGAGGDATAQTYEAWLWPNPSHVGFELSYQEVPTEFNPVDGYVEEKGLRGWYGALRGRERYEGRWLRSWEWWGRASRMTAEGGGLHHSDFAARGDVWTRDGGFLELRYEHARRPPNVDRLWRLKGAWKEDAPLKSGAGDVMIGRLVGGDYLYAGLSQSFQPQEDLGLRASGEYQRFRFPAGPTEDAFQGVVSAAYDITDERSVAGRYVNSGGKHNFYVSYRQVVRRGLDAYVIVGNPNVEKTEGRLALKLISCF